MFICSCILLILFIDTLTGSSGLDDGDYENVPPIATNAIRTTEAKQDAQNQKYVTVIADDNCSTENINAVDR